MENERTCAYCHHIVAGSPVYFQVGESAVPVCASCDDKYVDMAYEERE